MRRVGQPLSIDGAATSVVPIADEQPDRFSLYIHEAADKDGSHTAETVCYIVLGAVT